MRFLSSKIACILKWYLQRRLCWWRRSNLKIPKQFSLKVALELTKWANKNSRFLWNVKHCQLFGRGNYFVIFKSNKERKDKESQRTTGYTSNSRAWRDSGTRHVRNFFQVPNRGWAGKLFFRGRGGAGKGKAKNLQGGAGRGKGLNLRMGNIMRISAD